MQSPEVQARGRLSISDFVDIMCDDLVNEYTHMAFYLYHSSFVRGLHAEEYAEFFRKAAESEMQHVSEFLKQIHGFENLGLLPAEDLQLRLPIYGTDFMRCTGPVMALQEAIRLENIVVENYASRIKQAEMLPEPYATVLGLFYENQLEDSYGDLLHMKRLSSEYHRVEG